MQPQFDGRKDQLKAARTPTEEIVGHDDRGTPILGEPDPLPVWNPQAEADLHDDIERNATLNGATRTARKGKGASPSGEPPVPSTPPSASRMRQRRTQLALSMRAQGLGNNEIARRFGVSAATVTGWFTTHRREIAPEAIDELLDQIAKPLAIENLIHGLQAGDKDYTLETLKGRGVFRRHAEGEGKPPTELPALRISFELPSPDQMMGRDGVPVGLVIGQPQAPKQLPEIAVVPVPDPVVRSADGSVAPAPVAIGRPSGPDPDPARSGDY